MVLGLLAHLTPSIFFSRFLWSEALVYNSHFFQNRHSHTSTVISHAFVHSPRWRRKPWQGLLLLILLVVSKGYICEKVSAVRINREPTLESLIHRLYEDVLVWQCIVDSFAFLLRPHFKTNIEVGFRLGYPCLTGTCSTWRSQSDMNYGSSCM